MQESIEIEEYVPSVEELAMEALRQRMNDNRHVTPIKLAEYISRHLGPDLKVSSNQLSIHSIIDLCCYQRLLLIASRDACPVSKRKSDVHLQMVPGIHVTFLPEGITRNEHMEHQEFIVNVRIP
ncbi:hypothetical protein HUS91_18090 [Pseudomonas chlororaphis]|nr:hypothetical protein [Pseudomonas chlororaphis]